MTEKQKCKDCNRSLEDCTCIEDTIELPNQALIDAAERYIAGDNYNRYYDDFIEGARWQQEQIGKSEFLQRLRGTLSDAEARRLIFETFKNK